MISKSRGKKSIAKSLIWKILQTLNILMKNSTKLWRTQEQDNQWDKFMSHWMAKWLKTGCSGDAVWSKVWRCSLHCGRWWSAVGPVETWCGSIGLTERQEDNIAFIFNIMSSDEQDRNFLRTKTAAGALTLFTADTITTAATTVTVILIWWYIFYLTSWSLTLCCDWQGVLCRGDSVGR